MHTFDLLEWGLRLVGVGQIFIAIIYCWMRNIVGWDADVAQLRPLNRDVTQTYSRYIQAFNVIFGLICLLQPRDLLNQTPLAADFTLLMAVYWLGRLLLGLFYYDTREITSQRPLYRFAEYAFNLLFALQAAVLLAAFARDVGWLEN